MTCIGPGHPHRRTIAIAVAVAFAVNFLIELSGCASPQRPPPAPLTNSEIGGTSWLAEFEKPSEQILKGIDAPQRRDDWQIGTEVLYSVRIEGHGETLTRFVHFKLVSAPLQGIQKVRINPLALAANPKEVVDLHDPVDGSYELPVIEWTYRGSIRLNGQSRKAATTVEIKSGAVAAWTALYDDAGKRIKSRYALLPEAHLRKGLARFCEWDSHRAGNSTQNAAPTPEQITWIFESQAALLSFGTVVNSSPIAEPLVKQILPRSTLLGMWLFGKPKFGFDLGTPTPETRKLPALTGGRTGWQLPLTISMNDEPTLQCRITAVSPDSPYDLCAGIVAFEGVLIDHPERRFQMHLIAARRAAAATTSQARSDYRDNQGH